MLFLLTCLDVIDHQPNFMLVITVLLMYLGRIAQTILKSALN